MDPPSPPQHRTGCEEVHGPVQLGDRWTPAAGQAAVSEDAGLKAGSARRGGDSGRCHGACEGKLKTLPGRRRPPRGEA